MWEVPTNVMKHPGDNNCLDKAVSCAYDIVSQQSLELQDFPVLFLLL
jgi:hypothetical protein